MPGELQVGYSETKRLGQPGTRMMADGRQAPELTLVFVCEKCDASVFADAYLGPLTCKGPEDNPHSPTFMIPQT